MTIHLVRIFLFTLPFQFALNPFPGIDMHFSRVFAIAIFFSWLASGFFRKKIILPFLLPTALFFSFCLVAIASPLWSEYEWIAVRRSTFLLSFLPLFPVFSSIIIERRSSAAQLLLEPFFFGAAISGIIGLFQSSMQLFFGPGPVFHFWISTFLPFFLGSSFAASVAEYPSLLVNIGGATVLRASALFPDPHMFAYYMGMAVPIGLFFVVRSEFGFRKWLFLVCTSIVFFADLLSFSRGGYLGLIFGAVYLGTAIFFGSDAKKKLFAIAFLLVSALAIIFPGSPFGSRLFSVISPDDASNQGRVAMWNESMRKIVEKPLLGYGLGNYPFVVKPDASQREPIYAHNLLLDIATEVGIPVASIFLLVIISVFLSLAKTRPMIATSIVVFFGHSLVETPLYSVHVLPALLLLFAFGSVSDEMLEKRSKLTDLVK